MSKIYRYTLLAAATALLPFQASSASKSLWYDEPGNLHEPLTEGLPIGNGRLGALILGGVESERIVLNEDTLYAGGPYDPTHDEALDALPKIRELIFQNRHAEAQALVQEKFMARPIRQMSYQALCDLLIASPSFAAPSDYKRQLDLETAISTVSYERDGVRFTREAFASAPDNVLVFRFSADQPGQIDLDLSLDSPHSSASQTQWNEGIRMTGTNSSSESIEAKLRWQTEVQIRLESGWASPGDTIVRIRNADTVTLVVSAATNYVNWQDVSGDPAARNAAALQNASSFSYPQLRQRHLDDYQSYFQRFDLELPSTDPELAKRPTDLRIATYARDRDPDLAALYLHYARYLLLSSSRPGTQPANLQGLWNDKLFAPWGSKYTININTEMNYWAASALRIPETLEPLASMLADLSESGKRIARDFYDAPGWTTHHNTDLWRAGGPIDGAFWGMWQTGGAWLSLALWDRYLYSGDVGTLRADYPILKGVADFFASTLVEDPRTGYLVTSPSNSPENAHHDGVSIAAGPTMDNSILRDLFHAVAESSRILNVDADFRQRVESLSKRLPPLQIGSAGQLQEWQFDWDLDAPEMDHRHISHLYALHPGNEISPLATPELTDAALKTLELRGDEGTGWSLAWKINFWARLHRGERAADLIAYLISPGRCYPNMFDAHPPFQIDGNFGGANGMVEMLLQSHWIDESGQRLIHLLPALPDDWQAGSVKGLAARGGLIINLDWSEGQLTQAKLTATRPGSFTILHQGKSTESTLAAGESISIGR